MLRKSVRSYIMPSAISHSNELIAPHLEFEDGILKGGSKGLICTYCSEHFKGCQTRQSAWYWRMGFAICKEIAVEDRQVCSQSQKVG